MALSQFLWWLDLGLCGAWLGLTSPRERPLEALAALALGAAMIFWPLFWPLPPLSSPVFAVLVAANLAMGGWGVVCNRRTLRDKLAMNEFLGNNLRLPQWEMLMRASTKVPYNEHLFDYLRLRDPLRRYPPILRDAVLRGRHVHHHD